MCKRTRVVSPWEYVWNCFKKDDGKSNLDMLFTTELAKVPMSDTWCRGALFSVMCPCSEHGHKMTWDYGGGKVQSRGR